MEQRKPKKQKFNETVYDLGSGDSFYIEDFFSKNNADRLFNGLMKEITWESFDIKGSPVPRLISVQVTKVNNFMVCVIELVLCILSMYFWPKSSFVTKFLLCFGIFIISYESKIAIFFSKYLLFGTQIPIYRHPVDYHPETHNWCNTANEIRKITENEINQNLNHGVIQLYRDGKDFIGDHSDKTVDIRYKSVIANVSLGETRVLVLKSKDKKLIQEIELKHGSLYVLGWNTNREFTHCIRRNADPRANLKPRISLTFRDIATYDTNGILSGQGSNVKQQDLLNIFHDMNKKTNDIHFCMDNVYIEQQE